METIIETEVLCTNCQNPIQNNQNFCSACGTRLVEIQDVKINLEQQLWPSVVYYFLCVILIGIYSLTSSEIPDFNTQVIVDIAFIILTVSFGVFHWQTFKELYRVSNLSIKLVVLIIAFAILASLFVNVVASWLNYSLFEIDLNETEIYQSTPHPFVYSILFLGLVPAVFEEMAFRGFIFSNFKKLMSNQATLMVTTVLFGILHFSFIGLFWLLPLGYVFGWLRLKYKNLWYPMLAHFCYNSTIVFIELF